MLLPKQGIMVRTHPQRNFERRLWKSAGANIGCIMWLPGNLAVLNRVFSVSFFENGKLLLENGNFGEWSFDEIHLLINYESVI